jgi:hypothetical protein
MELVAGTSWILTKTAIIQKVKFMLEELLDQQRNYLSGLDPLPSLWLQTSPKISKGENYRGLPYLVLDFPRSFTNENIFAVRTLFWWGNFFSITLHLSGGFKKDQEEKIIAAYPQLKAAGFYLGVNEGEWEHHFEETNYLPVAHWDQSGFVAFIKEKPFIKLSNKVDLNQWDEASNILFGHYRLLVEILKN